MTTFRILVAAKEASEDGPPLAVTAPLVRAFVGELERVFNALAPFDPRVVAEPHWLHQPTSEASEPRMSPPPPIASIAVTANDAPGELQRLSEVLRTASLAAPALDLQTDSMLGSTYWAPGAPFGTLREAKKLIGAATPIVGTTTPVHVVIIDQGFDKKQFKSSFRGGWYKADGSTPKPGEGNSQHAAMVAQAVLDIAPNALLYDAPLIPTPPPGALPTVNSIPAFAVDAGALWWAIDWWLRYGGENASWILVNAWSIYDRQTDLQSLRQYTTDPKHFLNLRIDHLVRQQHADTVFAAGNCGQFDPDQRCGRNDRGPCRSIWGGNSLASVLTMSAVRTDGGWLGFSSQGPGQVKLGKHKPDLCAPAQFAADNDAYAISGGTSAACGLAGGVVAALRAQRDQKTRGPLTLLDDLRTTARAASTTDVTRVGHGIINLARAQAVV